ncbi:helix-turn-helix transcriptional regulator [Paucibacter sp. AS339]|uniref:helix-turn-helix transcriptional regulator n=1 Tax=Paucibacter hankyongi TaxID=3133434 RepID=UPI0030B2BDD4
MRPSALSPGEDMVTQAGQTERRQAESLSRHWMSLVLDELDYGVLLLNHAGRVLHCNLLARRELGEGHPLQLSGNQLRCRNPDDAAPLSAAMQAAEAQGRRCLLRVGEGEAAVNVVVVPLNRDVARAAVLLILERRELCGELAAQWFALQHGLTPSETAVLKALSAGVRPSYVAEQQGVAISTVRTQIQSIRAKSGADSIAELLRQLAKLPPLISTLRMERNPSNVALTPP